MLLSSVMCPEANTTCSSCVPDCKPHNIKVPTCPATATNTAVDGYMTIMAARKEDDGKMTIYKSDDGRMTAWAPQPTQ